MSDGIAISGLRELQRAFAAYDVDLKRELDRELRAAGDLVARDAPRLFPREELKHKRGFVSKALAGRVVVQPAIRSKHKRGDFGSLLFREVLYPTLQDKHDEIISRVELMLDRLGQREGF